MQLPITLSPEARLSFHLNVLLCHPVKEWIYERFINLQYNYSRNGVLHFIDNNRYTLNHSIYDGHIQISLSEAVNRSSFIDDIIELISKSYYCYAWGDKFYLNGALEYQKYHFAHPILVYGYDESENVFHILNFHGNVGNYTHTVTPDALRESLFHISNTMPGAGPVTERELIMACRVANLKSPCFHIETFIKELGDYLFSRCDDSMVVTTRQNSVFGIDVYEKFIEVSQNAPSLTFKSIYDFEYHKEALLKRFEFLRGKYVFDRTVIEHMTNFKSVAQKVSRLRLLAMKCNIKQKRSPAADVTDESFKRHFATEMTECKKLEFEILIPIYEALIAGKYNEKRGSEKLQQLTEGQHYTVNHAADGIDYQFDQPVFIRGILIKFPEHHASEPGLGRIVVDHRHTYLYHIGHSNEAKVIINLNDVKHISIEYGSRITDTSNMKVELLTERIAKQWDFTTVDGYDWETNTHIREVDMTDGMKFKVVGPDPMVFCWDVNVSAREAKYVAIEMKTTCDAEVGQLFFTTHTKTTFTGDMHKSFVIAADGEYHRYIVDLSDNEYWDGIIAALRLDPVGYDNKSVCESVTIKAVEVCDTLPVYDSSDMFCLTQDVNGWSYHYSLADVSKRDMLVCDAKKKWMHPRFDDVYIADIQQSSTRHFGTIRRWTCQATGEYSIKMTMEKLTSCENVIVSVRHNGQVLFEAHSSEVDLSKHEYTCESITMKYGDFVDFEFYNRSAANYEEVKTWCIIKKNTY